ncbi:uncharacterized protein MELLADRAFT_94651 [Melampsora larici-populina 98AG31]|uniref:Uncharacterized protein n=1 Tax=Melampsora larici-populina (strain 98AG31 / pathotype 3-4-7) TaxID=747676 RepID=F4S7G7_MELLP|nr:uncharacterized protein MELLADRAFT_94651 [Melampsora larici-populina 98AG31]EGF99406.1 hypothetical protein MELLADRAFT_94651 [Melampsora larici-populina 98AG31]
MGTIKTLSHPQTHPGILHNDVKVTNNITKVDKHHELKTEIPEHTAPKSPSRYSYQVIVYFQLPHLELLRLAVDVDPTSHYVLLTSSTPTKAGLTEPANTTNTTGSTGCFAYFNTKQGCASSNGRNNCPPKVTTGPVKQVEICHSVHTDNVTAKSQSPVKSYESNEVKESFLTRRKISLGTVELEASPNKSNLGDFTVVANSSDGSSLDSNIEMSSDKSPNDFNLPLSSGIGSHSVARADSSSTPPLANLSSNAKTNGMNASLSQGDGLSASSSLDSKTSLNNSNVPLTSVSGSKPVAGVDSLPTPPQTNLTSNATTGSGIPPSDAPISKPPTGGVSDASSSRDGVADGSRSSNPKICKPYDSETEIGLCLWSGVDQTGKDRKQSGWISASAVENCGKEIIFTRTGSTTQPIVGKLLDGCQLEATTPSAGCSQVWLTKKAFMALNPSAEEIASETLNGTLTWDFNSQTNPSNMAV